MHSKCHANLDSSLLVCVLFRIEPKIPVHYRRIVCRRRPSSRRCSALTKCRTVPSRRYGRMFILSNSSSKGGKPPTPVLGSKVCFRTASLGVSFGPAAHERTADETQSGALLRDPHLTSPELLANLGQHDVCRPSTWQRLLW
jgi:hypothetical protein